MNSKKRLRRGNQEMRKCFCVTIPEKLFHAKSVQASERTKCVKAAGQIPVARQKGSPEVGRWSLGQG